MLSSVALMVYVLQYTTNTVATEYNRGVVMELGLNGKRVKTGVYLVFCNDENGEETHITKLLFIH